MDQITLDPELAHGPVKDRKCTDVLCLILFLGCLGFSGYSSVYGFANGQPEKLFKLADTSGNICGAVGNATEAYPYLYFLDMGHLNLTVCVSSCPDLNKTENRTDQLNCYPNRLTRDCKTRADVAGNPQIKVYDTETFGNKTCIPSQATGNSQAFLNKLGETLKFPAAHQFYSDLWAIRWILLAVPLIALSIGGIYMLALRFFTGLLVWTTAFLIQAVLLAVGYFAYDFQMNPGTYTEKFMLLSLLPAQYVTYIMMAAWAAAIIYAFLLVFFWSRISLTVSILECSTRFVSQVPTVVFLPPIFFFVNIIYVVYWCVAGAYIFTVGDVHPDYEGYPIQDVEWTPFTRAAVYFHVFFGLWGFFFLLALNEFVIGFMTCMWYFSKDKSRGTEGVLRRALGTALFYHLGSIAFGSLILAIFSSLRIIWEFVQKRAKPAKESSSLINGLFRCVDWCFTALIGFIKYFNKHVYLEIAMTGEGFIGSSKDAFLIQQKNIFRFGFVHTFGSIFVFLGEICVAALTALVGYYYITEVEDVHKAVSNPLIPIIIIGVFGYLIGSDFMKIYGTAADGIVHCFCLDEELNADSHFAPEELRHLLQKREAIKAKEAKNDNEAKDAKDAKEKNE